MYYDPIHEHVTTFGSSRHAVVDALTQEEQLRADEAAAAAGEGQDRQQRERGAEAAARMRAALEWLGEATALVRSLSGVSIVEVHEDGLCLALATHAEVPGAVGWTGEGMLLLATWGMSSGAAFSTHALESCLPGSRQQSA